MDKIKDAASPILAKIQEERAGGGKHEKFLKYKKTFLMELMDVKKFGPTSQVYDTYVSMNDLNLKLNSFQQAYSKIDFESPTEDSLKRARELQRMAEDYREKLQGVFLCLLSWFATCTKDSRWWLTNAGWTSLG